MNDAALLRAWGEGDEAAGSRLVERHFGVVYRFFATKVARESEDLAQQTFLACVRKRESFDAGRGTFRAFVLGVARNELRMFERKRGREVRALQASSAQPDPVETSATAPLARRQELRVLLKSLRQLPSDLQIALELYYWEEMPTAEVGQVLGIPAGTVKSRLARGREQLREVLLAQDLPAEMVRSTTDNFERWADALRGLRISS